ncbi:MAG: cadherin-like beta sandwich domain-containing protein, partial [Clostridia bacterium]|nr:cadherin-like beta sandwich domain-containing protein [Clostridia bacterium]
MGGYPDGKFQPTKSITRAESISVLDRVIGVLYNEAGTYGATEKKTLQNQNVTINTKNVVLRNTIINGDLYLTKGIGDGHITLENVQVEGTTIISGGGENSIVIINSKLGRVIINVPDNKKVRLVAKGKTTVGRVEANTEAKLEETDLEGSGFNEVIIEVSQGAEVELAGDFEEIKIETPESKIKVQEGTIQNLIIQEEAENTKVDLVYGAKVKILTANTASQITGKGTIETANANEQGVIIQTKIKKIIVVENKTAQVNGQTITGIRIFKTSSEDKTAPRFIEEYPKAENVQVTRVDLVIKTNESGRAYYVVLENRANAPTAKQVKMGQDATGNDVEGNRKGTVELTANTQARVTIGGLEASTHYDIYVVAQDSKANLQARAIKLDVTTRAEEQASDEATLTALEVNPGRIDFDKETLTYNVYGVPNGTEIVEVTFTAVKGATTDVASPQEVEMEDGTGRFAVEVTAEDGTTKQIYIINFVEAEASASDEATLTTLVVKHGTIDFNKETLTYNVYGVPNGTEIVEVTFTAVEGATTDVASPQNVEMEDGTGRFAVEVTAEDGTTKQIYSINFVEAEELASDEANLTSLVVEHGTINFNQETLTYNDIEVPNGTANVEVNFTAVAGASTSVASPQTVNITEGTGAFSVEVTAEDGITKQTYIINFVEADPLASDEAEVTAYSFAEQTGAATINSGAGTIAIEVANGTEVSSLVATFALSEGATAEIGGTEQESGITTNDFTNPVTYTVTAEDGTTTKDWIVTVTEAPSDEAEITAYSFAEQTGVATINSGAGTIGIEVANGTEVSSLVATFTLSEGATAEIGATAQESGTTANDFTNPVTYTVTAEDGTITKDWVVTVTEAPSDEAEITGYSFAEQTGAATINSGAGTIGIEVANGTEVSSLVATFTLSEGATAEIGATAQVSATTANNFTNPVTYTVTAEDGTTTKDWIVTVTEAPSDEAEITGYSFAEQTGAASINSGAGTIGIEVANGTEVSSLVATFALSEGATVEIGATTQESGTTANDFTNPVTYTVTAEDGSTAKDWVVTVTEAPSAETEITGYSFAEQTGVATINSGAGTIAIEVANGTEVSSLVATFALSEGATVEIGATTQESGTTANDFTN